METLNLDFQVRGRANANNASQENNYKKLTVTTVPTKQTFHF